MEVAWLGHPALPIQFRKAWGGGENVATLHLLSPEDPTSKQLLRPWRVQLARHRNGNPNGF